MTTKYFKCTLLTDVVLNASLATEGNMQSLNFIPGSNFLGIVAKELYKDANAETHDIFHSEKVKFGDALVSINEKISYALTFSLFQDKLENKILKDTVWVHHGIPNFKEIKDKEGKTRQLKQIRSGYLNKEGKFIPNVDKCFSLKSAYNAEERRSDDGKMFGFDAIKGGQVFIFPVTFEDGNYFEQVKKALEGIKHLGKSKTAQYGQVEILEIGKPETFSSKPNNKNQLVIYAESRLCFLNEFGSPTFQPRPCNFGIDGDKIEFAWPKCQIRTNSYSPWNAKRNTPDCQRSFIDRGSVLVIENPGSIDATKLPEIVGEYQNEGFGRVIYNPEFLSYDKDGVWQFEWGKKPPKNDNPTKEPKTIDEKIQFIENRNKHLKNLSQDTPIGDLTRLKAINENKDLLIGLNILKAFETNDGKILLDGKDYKDKDGKIAKRYYITKSQWGAIRTKATNAESIESLIDELFKDKTGYLMHGVAAERIWDENNGERRDALKNVIEHNRELGTQFVAKFAAEIAKKQDNNG